MKSTWICIHLCFVRSSDCTWVVSIGIISSKKDHFIPCWCPIHSPSMFTYEEVFGLFTSEEMLLGTSMLWWLMVSLGVRGVPRMQFILFLGMHTWNAEMGTTEKAALLKYFPANSNGNLFKSDKNFKVLGPHTQLAHSKPVLCIGNAWMKKLEFS